MKCGSLLNRSCSVLLTILAVNLSPSVSRADLIGYWSFDEPSDSSTALDISGNGNDGKLEGGATFTGPGGGVTGEPGDLALDLGDFNNGAYLSLAEAALNDAFESQVFNDQATIAFWLFGNDEQPVNQWTFWFGPDRQLGSHVPWGDGSVYFDVAGCCEPNQRISKTIEDPSLFSGSWNHYAFVKDETYTAIYLNGALFHDSGDDLMDPLGFITEAAFGADANGFDSHGGLMDEIAVFDQPLDQESIFNLAFGEFIYPHPDGDHNLDGVVDIEDLSGALGAILDGDDNFDVNDDGTLDNFDVHESVIKFVPEVAGDERGGLGETLKTLGILRPLLNGPGEFGPAPEPSSLVLLVLGFIGILGVRRRV